MTILVDPLPTLAQLRRALAALSPRDPWGAVLAARIRVLETRETDLKRLTVEIYFIVDGKDYARREWPQVPPIGAHVMMHPAGPPEKYEVVAVLWGVNRDDCRRHYESRTIGRKHVA